MPRLKRTKVASSAPTSRVANTAPTTTHPSQERNIQNQSTGRVATTSDDSEGIVTTSATLRNRRGVEKRDVFMSGGLGTGDAQDAHRKPGATRRKAATVDTARALEQAKAIEGLKKRREAALAKQKVSVVEVPSSIPASGAEDEGFPTGGKNSEVMRREDRVSPENRFRARETPRAETSILALANFKRRPRQPSILQVPVQQGVDAVDDDLYDATDAEEDKKNAADQIGHLQPEDETELEGPGAPGAEVSILALANFKRRPRQPSILQVAVQQGVSNADDRDLYDDDDDVEQIGAFQPEDESTPLIVSKTKPQAEAILSPSPSSPTPESLPGSSSKKRKLTPVEVQVPRSSPPEARSPPSAEFQHNENYNSPDLHDDEQEPPSEQPDAHSIREPTPQIWSDTMAPPLSSSPSQPTPHSPYGLEHSVRPTTALMKRKQPSRNNHQSNRNNSPTKPSNLAAKPHTGTRQPLSTAALQMLLPRRRTLARARPSTFDISSSDSVDAENEEADPSNPVVNNDDDDDDELSHLPAKRPGARRRAANIAPAAAGGSKKPSPVKKQRAAAAAKKAAAAAAGGKGRGTEGPSAKTKAKRTYTRRVVSDKDKDKDKENADPDPEASHDGSQDEVDTEDGGGKGGDGRIRIGGPELERAARWFREVEKWELEFEEVTASSDSMMRDAR